jgi:pheromone a factor receptor
LIPDYIYQGHRFDIVEDFGCRATSYLSIPAIVLFYVPIVTIVVLTFIFATLAFRGFYIHRRAFTAFLQNTNSALTTARYVRLMVNIIVLSVWQTVVIGIEFGLNLRNGIEPYTSWADVHRGFSRAAQFPTALIPKSLRVWFYIVWWTIPLSGLVFFCAFSLGEDTVAEYGPWVRRAVRCSPCMRRMNRIHSMTSDPSQSSPAHLLLPGTDDRGVKVLDIGPAFAHVSLGCAMELEAYSKESCFPGQKKPHPNALLE